MHREWTAPKLRVWEHQAVAIMRRHPQGREIITLTKIEHVGPRLARLPA